MLSTFNLQGHRGARGLKPENTLPSFEVALDLGVSSIETDVHLTRDDVPVLFHDPTISAGLCRTIPGKSPPPPDTNPAIRSLTLTELRGYRADQNPAPERFPNQDSGVTRLAGIFAEHHEIDPYTPPTLADLFAFIVAYAGDLGLEAGKTPEQRARAARLRFDIELKRVPFRPERIGDRFDTTAPGRLEEQVVGMIRSAGMVERTTVRSFDHRCVRSIRQLEPGLTTAVLLAETAPIAPARLVRDADARIYAPDFQFLDGMQVGQCHADGVHVLPWTVNHEADWKRLLDWGVDGITTDFPDRLAEMLQKKGVAFA
jgi:glycerophosphoryl diester phosphodiesterase